MPKIKYQQKKNTSLEKEQGEGTIGD